MSNHPGELPDHWLWRLDAAAWVEAGRRELEHGQGRVGSRRTAVTHARRAAGMALNGALVELARRGWTREQCETRWGRSYIDHLRRVAASPSAGSDPTLSCGAEDEGAALARSLAASCAELLTVPVMPPQDLVKLGRRRDEAASRSLDLAGAIVEACGTFSAR